MPGDHVERGLANHHDAGSGGTHTVTLRAHAALAGAGFRRYATYRQATVAGAVANIVFGFLRCYVLLSVAGLAGTLAGYTGAQLVTFVWASQGLLAVVGAWSQLDLPDRVRTGDVVADLLRPVGPLAAYLSADLGRAAYGALTRFMAPLVVGMLAFDLYAPRQPLSYPLFAVSVLLAVLVAFCARYLIGLSAFWLLDVRGVVMVWVIVWGAGSGLYFPLPVLPEWLQVVLWVGTPLPATLQAPLDVLVERGDLGHTAVVLAGQSAWVAAGFAACLRLQRRAVRRLVVQGG